MGKNILAQMRQEYGNFTRSEQKIADYVLEHRRKLYHVSIAELSAECGVAMSTISLFCRKLKLASFHDFKMELVRSIATVEMGENQSEDEGMWEKEPVAIVKDDVKCMIENELRDACHMLAKSDVAIAVDLIQAAKQVLCLGRGNDSVAALAAWTQFSVVSPKFKTIQDSHMQTVAMSTLSREDVVLYFSRYEEDHEALIAAEILRRQGAKLVLITQGHGCFVKNYVDVVLHYKSRAESCCCSSVPTIIIQLFVIEMLVSEFIKRNSKAAEMNRQSVTKELIRRYNL